MSKVKWNNYPRAELMAGAQAAIDDYARNGMEAHAFFKASCPKCDERVMFNDPDICYERMECHVCGHDFPFIEGNYMILAGTPGDEGIDVGEAIKIVRGGDGDGVPKA